MNDLRNSFIHFTPKGWSIELQLIKGIAPDILDIIKQIADDFWPFRGLSDEDLELLRNSISDLRRDFRDHPTDSMLREQPH